MPLRRLHLDTRLWPTACVAVSLIALPLQGVPGLAAGKTLPTAAASCSQAPCASTIVDGLQLTLPSGVQSCANSGAGVACGRSDALNFFFQAEDGIRDLTVTGVQTCALPI